jgi:uncharacterized membrane protein YqgA involved in biofilm formation
MLGTVINTAAILAGSSLGLAAGNFIPAKTQSAVVMGLGFVTLSVGLQNSFATGNILIPLFSIALGAILGEGLALQDRLNDFGGFLQSRLGGGGGDHAARERFINAFVTASLVFCVGPLAVLGSIQDGMSGNYELLALKSALDFFASMAFAASLGPGVMASVIPIIILQGGFTLLGAAAGEVMTGPMTDELTATGGLVLMGIALILLDLKRPPMANYLPALLIAPLIVALGEALGFNLYPEF